MQVGHESRGIGMHARSILENLNTSPEYEYVIYAYDIDDPIKDNSIKINGKYKLVQTKTMKKSIDRPQDFMQLSRVIFHRFKPLASYDIDVFIQFDFMLGLPSLKSVKKTVLVAYDLIPLLFKDEYIPTPLHELLSHRGLLKKCKKVLRALYYQLRYKLHYDNFHKADTLLSISKNTTESLSDVLGISIKKIVTIPLAPVFNTNKATEPSGLATDKSFIFYIGATDARKRVSDLIEAFDSVKKNHDIYLVLAGKEFEDSNKIPSETILDSLNKSPSRKDIQTLGYVSDSEKLWLYRNALLFVFPTAYEGFGLPVVEAMQNGCPVISYNNSSITEIAGNAVALVPTGDIATLSETISSVLDDDKLRNRLIENGYSRSHIFTWDEYMTNFYSKLIN